MTRRKTPTGHEDIKKEHKEAPLKRKAGSEGGNGGGRNGNDGLSDSKRQKKYQNAVMKQAKKIVAAAVEADDTEAEALDTNLDAATKQQGNISSTTVAASAEGKVDNKATRLSSIFGRISQQK